MAKGKKTKKSPAKKKAPTQKTPLKKVKAKSLKTAAKKSPGKKSSVKWTEFVTPLDDRLMVQMVSEERKTAGGLYIPDTAADVSGNKQGIAVVVGRGHRDAHGKIRPMDVQIGDKVVFAEYAGSKIELLGETLILLRESEIMGILTS